MSGRVFRRITRLDPDRDHQEIYRLSTTCEFPFDTRRALEFALFRTFAIPSIAGLLDSTKGFERAAQKRYRETDATLFQIIEHGYDSPQGVASIERMNRIHRRFAISNEDMLYVLSMFIFEPIRWNRHFGWRPLTSGERRAAFRFWCEVGHRMGIREIPKEEFALESYNRAYESSHFQYSEAGRRVADRVRDLLADRISPSVFWPVVHRILYAMMDKSLLTAFRYPNPPLWLRAVLHGALRLRGKCCRTFSQVRVPELRTLT